MCNSVAIEVLFYCSKFFCHKKGSTFLSHVLLFILSINTIGLDTIPELTWRTYIFSMIKIIQI